jgi:uncharacterized protein (TIGR02145 family)
MKKFIFIFIVTSNLASCGGNASTQDSNNYNKNEIDSSVFEKGQSAERDALLEENEQTIIIGEQTWMNKNLDVSSFRNGDLIPEAKTDEEWHKAGVNKQPAWCYFFEELHGKKYGKLYNWFAVTDPRGLAPQGWHIPDVSEWEILINNLGGEEVAGVEMKSESGWEFDSGNGTNSSGFSALPSNYRAAMFYRDEKAYWWTSSEKENELGWSYSITTDSKGIYKGGKAKGMGIAVRCIKDYGD